MNGKATAIFAAFLVIIALPFEGRAQNVYKSVGEYLESLDGQPVSVIESKVDRLIGAAGDSSAMAKTAALCYDRYLRSPIMGYESVSLHIADNYFLNRKLAWPVEGGLTMLELFAEFNRNSMIGCRAPALAATDPDGRTVTIPDSKAVYKAIYFYDTQCTQCKVQTPLLKRYLKSYSGEPLVFYAFNTQADSSSWLAAAAAFDSLKGPQTEIVNAWDPNDSCDFHRLYGVLSTPQLYLVDRQNAIVGRHLDATALEQLLSSLQAQSKQEEAFFDQYFSSIGDSDEDMNKSIDDFYIRTAGDSTLFCNTFYDLYRYLKSRNYYSEQCGAVYLAEKYIIGKPEMWPQDIVQQCTEAVSLFRRNPLGETPSDLFLQDARGRNRRMLENDGKSAVLFFYDLDCPVCKAATEEMKSMRRLMRKKGVKVVSIYIGSDAARFKKESRSLPFSWTKLWDGNGYSQMHDKYNLSALPAIYLLDKDKKVIAKEINPINLKRLIEKL